MFYFFVRHFHQWSLFIFLSKINVLFILKLIDFPFFLFLFLFQNITGKKRGKGKGEPKIEFTRSKNGDQILLIDQFRYYKESEDPQLVFWKCHEHFKSKCEASVATMKKDRTRVVVLHGDHKHVQPRKPPLKKRN